ncbi:MAG: hypothetical protein L6Q37_01355 [Bdellovibrionaceae bacterium]|nr:hypothetical protein [Pseudobdellovibrionaceae bacterium]NUM59276.1 hypothetical protein [Pseudobdellovibrionaceae bacterium]
MGFKQISAKNAENKNLNKSSSLYEKFDTIDGTHPFKLLGNQAYVEYPVIELNKGKIIYFNFALAKEMGLLEKHHENLMNQDLEEKLLKTFSIQILNEYDILTKKKYNKKFLKKNKYMATRYLQLQHKNKRGATSGDGRSIWNGFIEHEGKIWDISSRGTGVTMLSPGAAEKKKPLQTGNTNTGYGCGQAEVDELLSSAIMSENLYNKGFQTERVLCVVDLGDGYGIGVRAGLNLIRPAHVFLYMKQNKLSELRKIVDYVIDRQIKNDKLQVRKNYFPLQKYQIFLNYFIDNLAKFTAQCESDYLFVWMDWDGDNLLIDPGIIDYGSIRHFGVCHDEYRYDDVDRFSTNLKEQKLKAKFIVKEMIQTIDFLRSGNKKNISYFDHCPEIARFNNKLNAYENEFFAKKIGLDNKEFQKCKKIPNFKKKFLKLKKNFLYLESLKTKKGKINVPDGVNQLPLFNMRKVSRELPNFLFNFDSQKAEIDRDFSVDDFYQHFSTKYATNKDEKWIKKKAHFVRKFLHAYSLLFLQINKFSNIQKMNQFKDQVKKIHPEGFLTGNSLIHSVDDMIQGLSKHNRHNIQFIITKLIQYLSHSSTLRLNQTSTFDENYLDKALWNKIVMNLHEFNEEI